MSLKSQCWGRGERLLAKMHIFKVYRQRYIYIYTHIYIYMCVYMYIYFLINNKLGKITDIHGISTSESLYD